MVNTMNRIRLNIFCLLLTLLSAWSINVRAGDEAAVLHWVKRVELSTPVSGVVTEVLVDTGAQVKKTDVLLRLDQRGFKAEVKQAGAELRKARDLHDEAQREVERSEELFDRMVLSVHELQLVKIAANRTAAELEAAQARLVQAELALEYSEIRAPFDALVLERHVQPGQTVVSRLQATPLLVLAAARQMQARVQLTPEQLGKLSAGQQVEVRVAGERYQGEIRRIGLDSDGTLKGAGRYPVDIEFTYPGTVVLRAGQEAVVNLP